MNPRTCIVFHSAAKPILPGSDPSAFLEIKIDPYLPMQSLHCRIDFFHEIPQSLPMVVYSWQPRAES
ncbi:MAG: hypothetical protein ONB27_15575 [candidate division KSB1 bacterium]|nr:hypothetical protein [candidate division KSB1 bacterium]